MRKGLVTARRGESVLMRGRVILLLFFIHGSKELELPAQQTPPSSSMDCERNKALLLYYTVNQVVLFYL